MSQTAQSPTCSIMEKPHTVVEESSWTFFNRLPRRTQAARTRRMTRDSCCVNLSKLGPQTFLGLCTGLDEGSRILLACFRARNSGHARVVLSSIRFFMRVGKTAVGDRVRKVAASLVVRSVAVLSLSVCIMGCSFFFRSVNKRRISKIPAAEATLRLGPTI